MICTKPLFQKNQIAMFFVEALILEFAMICTKPLINKNQLTLLVEMATHIFWGPLELPLLPLFERIK